MRIQHRHRSQVSRLATTVLQLIQIISMGVKWTCVAIAAFTCFCLPAINCVSPSNYDKKTLLNWCLKSKHHKKSPGKEVNLIEQCKPWQNHACCTKETSLSSHGFQNQYNFDLDHCKSQNNISLSEECKKHFIRDLCFYECEPNIGLWVVNVKKKFASERFFGVPLCASSCNDWWNACRYDFTCAYNWHTDFKWIAGVNKCVNSTCKLFKDVYKNASDFCEAVWDKSWKYTNDDKPCMKLSFDNEWHNQRVAEYYIDSELAQINACYNCLCKMQLVTFLILISLFASNNV